MSAYFEKKLYNSWHPISRISVNEWHENRVNVSAHVQKTNMFTHNYKFHLDLWLCGLDLCQLNLFIDINHASKFHLDRIIRPCFKDESNFSHNCSFDLDLWPRDLDLMFTDSFYRYLSYILISFRSNLPFMFYRRINVFT